ncbi:MAG: hypothetical protein JXQ75_07870 [Phycisphaerae bacterium]|nr:hypothetical protein [Phycisphaerae bacterium]
MTTRVYLLGDAPQPNYQQHLEDGRITTLSFDDDADGRPDETVELSGSHADRPHFIIVLDGVPFDVVKAMYDEGHFRLFDPPARLVSVFPAMTDVALSRVFHTKPCIAVEALYFDRERNALSNGNDVYMSGKNTPWTAAVDYHAPQSVAVNTYLNPWSVFSAELREMHRLFSRSTGLTRAGSVTEAPLAVAYSVGAAGIGTRQGEKGIRAYLTEVEKLCERVTYDRRGKVRFSILADHGQSLRQCQRVSFEETLTNAGFRIGKSIKDPNDVVIISYGLVTCAQFHTDRPRAVAAALVRHPGVDLAMFREGNHVVVQNAAAIATIRKRPGGFVYDTSDGDPLALAPILERLRAEGHITEDGAIADRPLLMATADHTYPDPLHRIWTCFDDLVEKPADLIVSLKPDACYGSKFFHFFVAPVASTHGGLDYLSSVTFLLTNATPGPPPSVLRSEDVLEALQVPPHDAAGAKPQKPANSESSKPSLGGRGGPSLWRWGRE